MNVLAPLPPAAVDPGVPGPYRSVTSEYELPGVHLPDFPRPVEMRAVVVAPQGAAGARLLALFLHGRHATCYRGEEDSNDAASPPRSEAGQWGDGPTACLQRVATRISVGSSGMPHFRTRILVTTPCSVPPWLECWTRSCSRRTLAGPPSVTRKHPAGTRWGASSSPCAGPSTRTPLFYSGAGTSNTFKTLLTTR